MEKKLYSVYLEKISTGSKKSIKSALDKYKETYAYTCIADKYIAFTNDKGIAYPLFVFEKIQEKNYVYFETTEEGKVFYIVTLNEKIITTDVTSNEQLLSEIRPYLQNNNKLKFFVASSNGKLYEFISVELDAKYININELSQSSFLVSPVFGELKRLDKTKKNLVAIIIFLCIFFIFGYFHFVSSNSEKKVAQGINSKIYKDPFAEYKKQTQKENATQVMRAALKAIKIASTLRLSHVDQIKFNSNILNISIVRFGLKANELKTWAEAHGFSLVFGDPLSIQKEIIKKPETVKRENTKIVVSNLIDTLSKLYGSKVRVQKDKTKQNYTIVPISLTLSSTQISEINYIFKQLADTPVYVKSISGVLDFNNFTGKIELNAIGVN